MSSFTRIEDIPGKEQWRHLLADMEPWLQERWVYRFHHYTLVSGLKDVLGYFALRFRHCKGAKASSLILLGSAP